MNKKPKIIVIGAGLAGLTAALRLYCKSYDVEVYEATCRPGGRVHTAYMKNKKGFEFPVELGGQNIADGGAAVNIRKLMSDLNLTIEERTISYGALVYQNGEYTDFNKLLSSLNWTKNYIQEMLELESQHASSTGELLNRLFPKGHALKDLLYMRLKAYEGIDPFEQSLYHNIDTLRCMLEGGLSVAHADVGSTVQKIMVQKVSGGNAKLPLTIAEILRGKLHFNKALFRVSYVDERINLIFKDGTQAQCDKLILATPVIPLKEVNFEEGMIPAQQFQKICKIQYGKNYKIIVPIEEYQSSYRTIITDKQISFFNREEGIMTLYFSDEGGVSQFKEQIEILKKGRFSLKISPENPLEAKNEQFTKYEQAITKTWTEDPYIQGSYTGYNTHLGKILDNRITYKNIEVKEIFSPLQDRIFFIGEHTTLLEEIGTMEAAVESGERIAKIFS